MAPEPATPSSNSLAVSTTSPPSTISTDYGSNSSEEYMPMTTHWTPQISCTWTYNIAEQPQPGASGAVAWLDLEPVAGETTLSCYPEGMFYNNHTGVFSPGTCPSGWTTVALQVPQNVDEGDATTTATCCSSEYSLVGKQCMRSVPTVLAVPITYNETASTYEILTNSTTTLYSATIAVYTIQARFQETDKELLGLTGVDDIDSDTHVSKLSLSAKVGIGVGVAIFALLALGLGVFLYYFRKNGKECRDKRQDTARHRNHGLGDESDCDVSYGENDIPLGPRPRSDGAPPPTYEAATERNSSEEGEGRDSPPRDEQIRALRAQQAALQRRIEELEYIETDDTPNETRN